MSLVPFVPEYVDTGNPVVRETNLLAIIHTRTSINSGGPPAPGALPQDDTLGSFVWTALAGAFLLLESDSGVLTEDDIVIITETE